MGRETNRNASRTEVREAIARGSTLIYRSKAPDAGRTGGIHIPRAPGRTSQFPPQARFQPVTRPLWSLDGLLLFPFIALYDLRQYISRICPACQDGEGIFPLRGGLAVRPVRGAGKCGEGRSFKTPFLFFRGKRESAF